MAKLIMGIGLAGAGKTTALEGFAKRYGYTYLSTDNIRAAFNIQQGEASPQSVWDEIRRSLKEHLSTGKSVVMDSTFVTGPDRRAFIEFAREAGAEKVQGIFLDTPAEIAWQRNIERERQAPREMFESRRKDLEAEPPAVEDGFDALFTLDQFQEMVRAETPESLREFKRFS